MGSQLIERQCDGCLKYRPKHSVFSIDGWRGEQGGISFCFFNFYFTMSSDTLEINGGDNEAVESYDVMG